MNKRAVVRQGSTVPPIHSAPAAAHDRYTGISKGNIMLDCWLYLRLQRRWASQAYAQAFSKIDIAPMVVGAALVVLGLMRI